jgi:hypothetical protein
MTPADQIKTLIADYQSLAFEMLDLLKAKVNQGEIDVTRYEERSGSFNDQNNRQIKYALHGSGCLFILNERINVDIDFAGPRYDTIDFYFLFYYFNSCAVNYPEIKNEDQLRQCMDELVKAEYLLKEGHNMYYLKSAFDHPKEFEWR